MKTIISRRFKESETTTISKFITDDESLTGYFLEPEKSKRIPAGTYKLIIHDNGTRWNAKTFPPKGVLELVNVPEHTEVLIHVGNYRKDTEDCLLPGDNYGRDYVGGSKDMMTKIMNYLPEQITIIDLPS